MKTIGMIGLVPYHLGAEQMVTYTLVISTVTKYPIGYVVTLSMESNGYR